MTTLETETIDRLFLELSQVTQATTKKELQLQLEIETLRKDAELYRWLKDPAVWSCGGAVAYTREFWNALFDLPPEAFEAEIAARMTGIEK